MKNLRVMTYSAILLPALAMGVSVASADEHKGDEPCKEERTTATTTAKHDKGETRGPIVAGNAPTTVTRANAADKDNAKDKKNSWEKNKSVASNQSSATLNTGMGNEKYLENKPADNFFTSNLIGQEVKNNSSDDVVGTVEEILINRDGQIAAVVLSTGGLMGLGEKEVAINWNQIDRTMDENDEVQLSVDFTESSIADAPKFARENGNDLDDDSDDYDRN